jgi:thymidylate synthase (FAD)
MQWVNPSVTLIDFDSTTALRKCELAARNCYKSEDKIGEGTAEKLIRGCIKRGHESVIEHASVTFRMICDRGVTHELVRHRMASYSQESTRYVNYNKKGIEFIYPFWYDKVPNETIDFNDLTDEERKYRCLWWAMSVAANEAEENYECMISAGATPQEARAVLPNMLKTDIVVTMNMREIRHFIKLRAAKAAHPDIRILAKALFYELLNAGYGAFLEDLIDEVK